MPTIVDLKEHLSFLPQYVELRNRYVDLLLTTPVDPEETRKWLARQDVEIRCLIDDAIVLGSVILYLHRGGEVAFFVRTPGKGLASPLLQAIEQVARNRECTGVWAWVLLENERARKAFLKAGYIVDGITEKLHQQVLRRGYILRKQLQSTQTVN